MFSYSLIHSFTTPFTAPTSGNHSLGNYSVHLRFLCSPSTSVSRSVVQSHSTYPSSYFFPHLSLATSQYSHPLFLFILSSFLFYPPFTFISATSLNISFSLQGLTHPLQLAYSNQPEGHSPNLSTDGSHHAGTV